MAPTPTTGTAASKPTAAAFAPKPSTTAAAFRRPARDALTTSPVASRSNRVMVDKALLPLPSLLPTAEGEEAEA